MLTTTSPCEPGIDDCGVPLALPVLRTGRRVPLALPVHAGRVPLTLPAPRQKPLIPHALENGLSFVTPEGNRSAAYRTAKRALDLLGAAMLLVLLGPLMLAVLAVLAVTTRGKPLYFQRRVGYRGRSFRMIKFRTMQPEAEKMQHQVENEHGGPSSRTAAIPASPLSAACSARPASTKRRNCSTSWRARCRWSARGPRSVAEVAQYRAWHCRRLAVMPGLTCLWQVSGRSEIGFEDWVRMDLWYLRHQSLWTDCKLLLRTPLSVLSGRGAY